MDQRVQCCLVRMFLKEPTKVFNNIHKYKGAETDEELGSIYKYKGAETDEELGSIHKYKGAETDEELGSIYKCKDTKTDEELGSIYKCKDTETSIKDLAANVDLGKARAYLYLDNRISAAYCSS